MELKSAMNYTIGANFWILLMHSHVNFSVNWQPYIVFSYQFQPCSTCHTFWVSDHGVGSSILWNNRVSFCPKALLFHYNFPFTIINYWVIHDIYFRKITMGSNEMYNYFSVISTHWKTLSSWQKWLLKGIGSDHLNWTHQLVCCCCCFSRQPGIRPAMNFMSSRLTILT